MRLLYSYISRYKKTLALALVLATVNQVFSLLDPQIFRLIIDRYATRAATWAGGGFLSGVLLLLLASVGVAFVSRVAKNFQDYYVNVITQRVGAAMYAHSIAHSFSLPYAVFEDQRSGELLQKLQKARTDSQIFITSAINVLFLASVGIVFVIVYAFMVHWSIGLLYALLIPALSLTTYTIGRRIKAAQARIVREAADLAGSTTETLRNVELVKSLGLEAQEAARLNAVNEKVLELELRKVRIIRALSFIQGTLINAMRSTILLLMLWLIFAHHITLGQFLTLYLYSFFIFNPLGEFGNVSSQYQEARGSMEAVEKILEIPSAPHPANPGAVTALESIEFENVSFAYNMQKEYAIQNISLAVKRGETVALVGPSGCGKSTMVKLLVGLYFPKTGKIFVNGRDISAIDLEMYRHRIGYVSQETQLFAGTIRENLLFVEPEATDAECLAALEQAEATPILKRSGQGLDTRIGEGGIKISGGERQRLAIARALLRKPDLIIFDEATSSLDSITEKAITDTICGINQSRPNLMTVLVAHRLSTVAHADRIYVLEKGRVVEHGPQKKLLARGTLFSALWREQMAAGV